MDPDSMTTFFVLTLLILLSAFFSSSETALLSFNRIRLKHLIKEKNRKGLLISKLLETPEKLITTILIGNNIVNIFASTLATAVAIKLWGNSGLTIATIAMTIIILLFGEVIPKSIATGSSEKISFIIATPIKIVMTIFSPVVKIFNIITTFIKKVFRIDDSETPFFTIEEFKTMIDVGKKEGVFEEEEQEMLHGIVTFGDNSVKAIMKTHRTDIVAFPADITYKEVKNTIISEQFSRYPVYEENIDNIIGILYAKDLFKLSREEKENFDIKKVMIPKEKTIFIPGTKRADALFKDMKRRRIHIAIVLDEYFGTMGIVTLEDLLEVIVGNIEDETDSEEEKHILDIRGNYALVSSNTQIKFFNEKFNVNIPNHDIETIGGFILKKLERLPQEQEVVKWEDLVFTVMSLKENKHYTIKIEKRSLE